MCGGFRLSVGLFMQQFRQKRTSLELPVDFSSVWEGRGGKVRGVMLCVWQAVLCSPSGRVWQSKVSLGCDSSQSGSESSVAQGRTRSPAVCVLELLASAYEK